ncbi:SDR family NAD(P)-dependent oxidoreductase [Zhongshania aquimaris]|uniref:SDR family NAD(P)-dependent oxidoreductase n=1 Tax=Zhongshania aquimaris TaxID=2857107 RepID=A0ABS6VWN1_9GAMM|nr:SDR family NAD(P)-dependent oxidoreductase [Zhongshania aquimaris]MBW2942754.1 SDR family NAD(P)-dependent oxidoreductase [Zhongshania aquimaris]
MELKDRVVVITGALGSLGRAVSAVLAEAGAKVVGIDCVDGKPESVVAVFKVLDLGDAAATKQTMAAIAAECGHIDALVNIAGGFAWETLADGAIETWDQQYQINLRTAVSASSATLAHFPGSGGRIINISAAGAMKAAMGMGAYAAAKSGVARFTEALSEELKPKNITVNALMPSVIDTKPNRDAMPDADYSTWVTPKALAEVILFLASDRGEPITGALIPVMGRV